MITASSIQYGVRSAILRFDPEHCRCPNCGSRDRRAIERKWIVTELVRCGACGLMYRLPTDPSRFGRRFYQREYRQGFTSTCPTPEALAGLIASGFAGTDRDYSTRIAVLQALGVTKGARVLDRTEDLAGGLDVFFSSHVIEHVPAPRDVISLARRLLRSGGLFVAFTPNGSAARRAKPDQAHNVMRMWGLLHPIVLDDVFYSRVLPAEPKLLATSPYPLDSIRRWDQRTDLSADLSGKELLLATVLT